MFFRLFHNLGIDIFCAAKVTAKSALIRLLSCVAVPKTAGIGTYVLPGVKSRGSGMASVQKHVSGLSLLGETQSQAFQKCPPPHHIFWRKTRLKDCGQSLLSTEFRLSCPPFHGHLRSSAKRVGTPTFSSICMKRPLILCLMTPLPAIVPSSHPFRKRFQTSDLSFYKLFSPCLHASALAFVIILNRFLLFSAVAIVGKDTGRGVVDIAAFPFFIRHPKINDHPGLIGVVFFKQFSIQ